MNLQSIRQSMEILLNFHSISGHWKKNARSPELFFQSVTTKCWHRSSIFTRKSGFFSSLFVGCNFFQLFSTKWSVVLYSRSINCNKSQLTKETETIDTTFRSDLPIVPTLWVLRFANTDTFYNNNCTILSTNLDNLWCTQTHFTVF